MSAERPRTTLLVGGRLVNVAGESHYQEALREIVGSATATEIAVDTEAVLVPEPSNPHDANAVMVQIDGKLVGYLPRDEAVAYGPALAELGQRGRTGLCEARIAGRGGESGTSNLGVFLRLPDPHGPDEG